MTTGNLTAARGREGALVLEAEEAVSAWSIGASFPLDQAEKQGRGEALPAMEGERGGWRPVGRGTVVAGDVVGGGVQPRRW